MPAGAVGVTKPAISQYASAVVDPRYRFYLQPKLRHFGPGDGRLCAGELHRRYQRVWHPRRPLPGWEDLCRRGQRLGEYNVAPNISVRLAPEFLVTGFGSTTQHSLGYTGSIVYRFGKQ